MHSSGTYSKKMYQSYFDLIYFNKRYLFGTVVVGTLQYYMYNNASHYKAFEVQSVDIYNKKYY